MPLSHLNFRWSAAVSDMSRVESFVVNAGTKHETCNTGNEIYTAAVPISPSLVSSGPLNPPRICCFGSYRCSWERKPTSAYRYRRNV